MSDHGKSYPEPVPERRIRARSRPNYSDRRNSQRFHSDFPVSIYVGEGKDAQVYEVRAKDISSGGLLIDGAEIPKDEKRIRVRFKLPEGVMPEQFVHGAVKMEAEVRRRDEESGEVGLQFKETLDERLDRTVWFFMRWLAIMVLFAAVCVTLVIKYQNVHNFFFDVPVFAYSLLVGGYLLSRFLFAAFYRPSKPVAERPPMSVIIPAHDEEDHIERTVRQIMDSDYPREKLQVIAVDDGSTDSTLERLRAVQETYPELVVIHLPEAQGKREALATGVRLATGEYLVFVDSDSFLEPDALGQLLNRFKRSEVAAVTGHCDVENQWTNLLTKMQSVRYYTSFRVMKAAESIFGVVTCLSGPIAAYRRDRLMEVMEDWLNQRFLGRPATFGDDRSLTNMLLRKGYEVEYESRARCTTMVPEHYRQFLRQQMRWKRSWFRESMIAMSFMWRTPPFMAISFYLGFLLPLISPAVVLRALIYVPVVQRVTPLAYLMGVTLMSVLLSSVYMIFRRSKLWWYGIPFCFFYMFVLVWQMPWAVLTFFKTSWGTRS